MIDLHTHSFYSDGVLIPSELVVRAKSAGYSAIAITDHVDYTNMDFVLSRIKRAVAELSSHYGIKVLAGCEITYVHPTIIRKAVGDARKFGAEVVLVHGETPVEPVPEGTNRAAIEAACDILAHPGHITREDVILSSRKGVYLEITTRKGHSLGNKTVAALSKKYGAKMVLNTDSHLPKDLLSEKLISKILKGAGLSQEDYSDISVNAEKIVAVACRAREQGKKI